VDLNQLNELDLQNIGEWPNAGKALLILFLCVAVAAAWYYFDSQDQLEHLRSVEATEATLRADFESKQQKAANLEAYRHQLAEMKESFGAMLRQLPDKTEVAALLVDVSQTGLAAGLEFERFQPADEILKDFYAELPIEIRVTGQYHEFGHFISGLAALPRIVTIHDVTIEPRGRKGNEPGEEEVVPLNLKATVRTYRYLDEEAGQEESAK
jgi:type IV pilus assembly protein PilO